MLYYQRCAPHASRERSSLCMLYRACQVGVSVHDHFISCERRLAIPNSANKNPRYNTVAQLYVTDPRA
jgi:hypothetical protein